MNCTRNLALLECWVLLASGCGTVANLKTGEPEFYGGVQKDVQWLETPSRQSSGIGVRNPAPFVLLDLPLSAIGDTLTLPFAIYEWHRGEGRNDNTEQINGGG